MKRERVTRIVLAIVGLIDVSMIYFLYLDLWHSSWLLVQHNECDPMFLSFFIPVGVFLLMAALMAMRTAMTREDCTLRLKVQHGFLSAQLFVWLDEGLVYSGRLIGSRKQIRSGKKKAGLSGSAEGSLSETFAIPAGTA